MTVERDTDLQRLNRVLAQLQTLQDQQKQLSDSSKVTAQEVAGLQQKNEELKKAIDEMKRRRVGL